jgi:hypothetical protein
MHLPLDLLPNADLSKILGNRFDSFACIGTPKNNSKNTTVFTYIRSSNVQEIELIREELNKQIDNHIEKIKR